MEKIKTYWKRLLLISLSGVCIWGFSRGFIFKKLIPVIEPPDIVAYGASFLVQNGIFFQVLTVVGIIVLVLYSVFYVFIEDKLAGNKYIKGLTYGLSFYLIYSVSFFEFYHFFKGAHIDAVYSGFADGLPLLITGILLGIFIPSRENSWSLRPKQNLFSILFISVLFSIGRTIFYNFIYPTPLIKQFDSYIYLSLYGATVGLVYYFLSQGIKGERIYRKPLVFGMLLGPVLISGNIFISLKYNFPFGPAILISIIDLFMIISGGLINEEINKNENHIMED